MKKTWILLLSMLLLLTFAIAGCDKEEAATGEVNGQPITATEYNSHLSFLKYYYEVQQGAKLDEEKDQTIIETLENQTFDDLVLKKLLWQQAEKEKIVIEEKVIDEEIKKAKENQGEESFKKVLTEMGMSEKQLREQIKTEKIYAILQEKVTADIKVTDEETQKYYEENSDLFVEEGGMEIAHILVDTEEKAKEVIAKLSQGNDFAELAKEYSTCPSSAQGGELGLINENSGYVPEFKEPALKLKEGEITTEPVKSEFGFHVIKAGTLKEARTIPFEEIKTQLTAQLLGDKTSEAYYNYLQELHKNADIVDFRTDKAETETEAENK